MYVWGASLLVNHGDCGLATYCIVGNCDYKPGKNIVKLTLMCINLKTQNQKPMPCKTLAVT